MNWNLCGNVGDVGRKGKDLIFGVLLARNVSIETIRDRVLFTECMILYDGLRSFGLLFRAPGIRVKKIS